MPTLVPYLNCTPIIECYVIRCDSKNKYQKDACLREIELQVQFMITVLGSIVNILRGDLHD